MVLSSKSKGQEGPCGGLFLVDQLLLTGAVDDHLLSTDVVVQRFVLRAAVGIVSVALGDRRRVRKQIGKTRVVGNDFSAPDG